MVFKKNLILKQILIYINLGSTPTRIKNNISAYPVQKETIVAYFYLILFVIYNVNRNNISF